MSEQQAGFEGYPLWAMRLFYGATRGLMALVLRVFGRWRVRGRANVPRAGALIVVANHLHNADPPLIAASVPRRIRFMAKSEFFGHRASRLPIGLFGSFPVRRGKADLGALRRAQRLLEQGEAVGLLPEGTRNKTGIEMHEAHLGAALLALRTGAPVLPVGIVGTEQIHGLGILLQHPLITVTIGRPLALGRPQRIDRAAVEAATATIMRAVAAQLPPAYRGVWAGSDGAAD
jgi:1-acyl-sn-glycerol-3-phosphate acyltransferase